jgi:hypothetical protein
MSNPQPPVPTFLEHLIVRLLGEPDYARDGAEPMWDCPVCGGHLKFHTRPATTADRDRFACWSCDTFGDVFDAVWWWGDRDPTWHDLPAKCRGTFPGRQRQAAALLDEYAAEYGPAAHADALASNGVALPVAAEQFGTYRPDGKPGDHPQGRAPARGTGERGAPTDPRSAAYAPGQANGRRTRTAADREDTVNGDPNRRRGPKRRGKGRYVQPWDLPPRGSGTTGSDGSDGCPTCGAGGARTVIVDGAERVVALDAALDRMEKWEVEAVVKAMVVADHHGVPLGPLADLIARGWAWMDLLGWPRKNDQAKQAAARRRR